MKKVMMTMMMLAVAISLTASCGQRQQSAASIEQMTVEEGKMAPDFELPDLQGKPTKLSSLRGKYVVIDFWGAWCIWCVRGIPNMKEAYAKHKDKMEILGVDCRDTEAKWKAAVKEHELPWKQVRCPDDKFRGLMEQYSVEGFPTKVIVDPKGKIVKVVTGEDPSFYTFLDSLFE
ncbi:TlpA family protein disulfide reductase [Prevotella sp. E15-22]|jgi:peroxiredoxin|uniref:TlpA family protein disulfide reductase n=1 Tax=Prevotella sp. E15-22 TaxID=2937774 RepID=UPI003530A29A